MNCYEAIDVMGEAIDGTLAGERRTGLDGHLAECRPCRVYLEQLIATRRALGSLPAPESGPSRRSELLETFRREFGRKDARREDS